MRVKEEESDLEYSKICFLSNFPPKECGIATFTRDLTVAMNKKFNPKLKSRVIALNEDASFYNYDSRVIMQLNKDNIADYKNIAKKVNNSHDVKLICIQHEFGLFGGNYGAYLLHFLEEVEKPVIIAFHSVLPNPEEERKEIVKAICSKAAAIIVMAEAALDILSRDYDIDRSKMHVVHHGIPNVTFAPDSYYKRRLKLDNKIVLSTFGLLSKGKGVEYMIQALPPLVKKYPNILYLIMGETHPVVRKKEGEKYRNELMELVNQLGLQDNVKFYNRYLTLQEIIHYILASDIYICTNLERNQIVSGTLSYALGCGRAVVSTPIIYAEEMLADGRGLLSEFKNPESFTKAIDTILSDKNLKRELERRAYAFSRPMIWQNIASRYLAIFNRVVRLREETTKKFPIIKLNHLKNLTDNFGCIQFSKDAYPDKSSGYTLDDNARALIVAILHYKLFKSAYSLNLAKTYLTFLERAQEKNGNFKNNFHNKNETLDSHSPDAFGRAIWALGYTINNTDDEEVIKRARKLFKKSYKTFNKLIDLRAKAFSIMGLYYYNQKYKSKRNKHIIKKLANSLLLAYRKESRGRWQWFEKEITYSSSKLPEALFLAYAVTKNTKYLEAAEKTFHFLSDLTFIDDKVMPIGQNGWYKRYRKRAFFDQQPVDVSSLVQTLLIAHEVTGDRHCHEKAVLAFNWFLGKNYLNQMVYNETTGGCYDGLSERDLNLNQGAESSISYLMARLMLEEVKRA